MPAISSASRLRGAVCVLAFLVLPWALAGCMSFGVPPASAIRLARLSPLEADPGAIRFALSTPAFLRLRDGDITVTVRYDTGDPASGFVEQYKPIVTDSLPATPGIDRSALADNNLAVARFDRADIGDFRAMQARIKTLRSGAGGRKGKGQLSISASGCRIGPVGDGPVPISAWLQTDPGEDYFVLMRGFDLRKQLEAAGADAAKIPRC